MDLSIIKRNKFDDFPFEEFITCVSKGSKSFRFNNLSLVLSQEGVLDLKSKHTYFFDFKNRTKLEHSNAIVICTKGMPDVFSFVLSEIDRLRIGENSDILLVDDRPSNSTTKKMCKKLGYSYLSVFNDQDVFNYSIINNIAAAYCFLEKKETITFWNNDMWPENESTFQNILSLHIENKSDITGVKLIYPKKEFYKTVVKSNKHALGKDLDRAFGTIQHAGVSLKDGWIPNHEFRFENKDTKEASTNKVHACVTGAFHLVDLKNFINVLHGYSISLSCSFQDIDLCLRATNAGLNVYYAGGEAMLHAESISLKKEGVITSPERHSDFLLYQKKWQKKQKLDLVI
jgi:GT2 family glycosyltransferase